MRFRRVHHVEFSVLDYNNSIKFYDRMFGWLGYKSFWTLDIGYRSTYYMARFPVPHSYIGIQADVRGEQLNYQDHAIGIHHIALWAPSRVVSDLQIQQPSSMSPYLNILVDGAFGNYRDLLQAITLNPATGDYLDMVNNDKANTAGTIQPNENYGREALQLFSIGLYALNPDGTPKTDPNGETVPAYDQDTIEGFSHAFTGWTYATQDGATPKVHNPRNYLATMWLYRNANGVNSNHDKGEKLLLDYPGAPNSILASNQDGEMDLQQALDNIFHHPNMGPFIGRHLIQNLVTSNPSPGYVKRVAGVFDNNGSGVRGDLYATVKAILLDREARGTSRKEMDYGHLREPVLYVANLLRALNATSDGIVSDQAKAMGQNLFYSPSVFNYYPHDYTVPGTSVQGPEFGIETSSGAIARANFVNKIAFSKIQPKDELGTSIDLSGLRSAGGDAVGSC